jgi:hypothetical protein
VATQLHVLSGVQGFWLLFAPTNVFAFLAVAGCIARFTRDLVKPRPDQVWLLVTTATHATRAVGVFRQAGFDVMPYPTDYVTIGNAGDYWKFPTDPIRGLMTTDMAVREWAGLIVYKFTEKIDSWFPGPSPH